MQLFIASTMTLTATHGFQSSLAAFGTRSWKFSMTTRQLDVLLSTRLMTISKAGSLGRVPGPASLIMLRHALHASCVNVQPRPLHGCYSLFLVLLLHLTLLAHDLYGPLPVRPTGHLWIVITVDPSTRYSETSPLCTGSAFEVADFFLQAIFLRHGPPHTL